MHHIPDLSSVSENTDATVMQPKHKQSMNNVRLLPGECLSYLEILKYKICMDMNRNVCVFCFTVNCEEYLAKEETQIPVDEVFFYRCVCVCVF